MQPWSVFVILFGHFTAAFAALGMPPFFALILQQSLHNDSIQMAGWLYAVPIMFTALSAPWWGRLADRVGKRVMLVRAQLGLALSFLLAGFAESTTQFFIALVLQGVLGGTFGASNAYLAGVLSGRALSRSLTLMQGSARAALVSAPLVLGLCVEWVSPIILYRYLAVLPLVSAVLMLCLPALDTAKARRSQERRDRHSKACTAQVLTARQIYLIQFGFVFATVTTFPYFIPFVQHQPLALAGGMAGLLFGLPHLVYLVCFAAFSRWFGEHAVVPMLVVALLLLGVSLLGQVQVLSLAGLTAYRLLMGVAMTLAFIALHGAIAAQVKVETAGTSMGWMDSSAKWGGVFGAIGAGLAAHGGGLAAPFLVGAACLMLIVGYLAVLSLARRRFVMLNQGKE